MIVAPQAGPRFLVDSLLAQPPAHQREQRDDRGDVEHEHIVGVRVLGELDLLTAQVFTAELACAGRRALAVSSWAARPALQMDLSGLTFLDTAGVGALLETHEHLAALGCHLCLTNPRPDVLRLLDLAVFSAWLPADVECNQADPWPAVALPIRPKVRRRSGRCWSPARMVPWSPPVQPLTLSPRTAAHPDLHPAPACPPWTTA